MQRSALEGKGTSEVGASGGSSQREVLPPNRPGQRRTGAAATWAAPRDLRPPRVKVGAARRDLQLTAAGE